MAGAKEATAQTFFTYQELLEALDTNHDGQVDRDEFLAPVRMSTDFTDDTKHRYPAYIGQAFDTADLDGNGVLNERELEYADYLLQTATPVAQEEAEESETGEGGSYEFNFHVDAANDVLKKHDADQSGGFDKEEYMDSMRAFADEFHWRESFDDPGMQSWMEEVWSKADVTGDGVLSRDEVTYLWSIVDRELEAGSLQHVALANGMFFAFDADEDGRITEEELAKHMKLLRSKHNAASVMSRYQAAREEEDKDEQEKDEKAPPSEEEEEADYKSSIFRLLTAHFADADTDGDRSLDSKEAFELAKQLLDEL